MSCACLSISGVPVNVSTYGIPPYRGRSYNHLVGEEGGIRAADLGSFKYNVARHSVGQALPLPPPTHPHTHTSSPYFEMSPNVATSFQMPPGDISDDQPDPLTTHQCRHLTFAGYIPSEDKYLCGSFDLETKPADDPSHYGRR